MGGCVSTPQASPGPSPGAHKPAGPPPVAQSGQDNQQRLKIRVNDEVRTGSVQDCWADMIPQCQVRGQLPASPLQSGKMRFKRTDSGRVVLEVLPKSLEEGAAGVSWGVRRAPALGGCALLLSQRAACAEPRHNHSSAVCSLVTAAGTWSAGGLSGACAPQRLRRRRLQMGAGQTPRRCACWSAWAWASSSLPGTPSSASWC